MFKSGLNGQLKRLFLALGYVLQTKENRYSMFMYVSSLFQQEQRGLPTCIILQMVRFQLNYKVELYFWVHVYNSGILVTPLHWKNFERSGGELNLEFIYLFFRENQPQQNKL